MCRGISILIWRRRGGIIRGYIGRGWMMRSVIKAGFVGAEGG